MIAYIWPIALVVFANVMYQVCAKSMPGDINPLAALTVTYMVALLSSGILYFALNRGSANLIAEYSKLNWVPFVFGLVLVGLEVGFIYAYKAGWQVNTAAIVQSAFLAVALIFVGFMIYHEPITWNKLIGVGICVVGLIFINMK
ncbi:MAG: EamA family transporter [Bacillota bacterium]|nr:EamA family transporter [Bacillota bacterium]